MDTAWAQTVATWASTASAIGAIIIGYYQFKNQQTTADKIVHANVKPLLGINMSGYIDYKAVNLQNYGAVLL